MCIRDRRAREDPRGRSPEPPRRPTTMTNQEGSVSVMKRKTTTLATLAIVLGLALTGCGTDSSTGGGGTGDGAGKLAGADLAVGSKEFTGSSLLGKIPAHVLKNAGGRITEKTGRSGRATVREAR